MFQGRVSVFCCDFCEEVQYVHGYSLPDGWKWIPGMIGVVGGNEVRHICKPCADAGKHGDLPLVDSGQLSPQSKKQPPKQFKDWVENKLYKDAEVALEQLAQAIQKDPRHHEASG